MTFNRAFDAEFRAPKRVRVPVELPDGRTIYLDQQELWLLRGRIVVALHDVGGRDSERGA